MSMRMLIAGLSLGLVVILGIIGWLVFAGPNGGSGDPVWTVSGGDSRQGRRAVVGYGCSSCHVISGVRRATGRVGPKLEEIVRQIYIGGVLPNSPNNLIRWIRNPQEFSPETAMPDLAVSEQDARHIASHLYGLQ
jgi:cytochrome c2